MTAYDHDQIEKARTTIGSIAILAAVVLTTAAVALMGIAQMA
jgi:hypothetical protein